MWSGRWSIRRSLCGFLEDCRFRIADCRLQIEGERSMKRREFLQATAVATGATMLPGRSNAASTPTIPQGKAEHCIFLWLGGGAGQIDTWDPKEKRSEERRIGKEWSSPW